VDSVKSLVRHAMVIDKFVRTEIVPKVAVTPEDESKFYNENRERMKRPETVRASHILLRAGASSSAEERQTQKTKSEDLLGRVRKGEDFASLAKENSQDTGSAPNGGDLGYFPRGRMVPQFDEAVWALKVGEISPVVETPFGYHIIKVTDKKPEGFTPLDEVRPQIKEYLSVMKTQEQMKVMAQSMRASAKIEELL